jgi:hypothetical protein
MSRYDRKHGTGYNPDQDLVINTDFSDLQSYGFYFLTGEACALNQRALVLLSQLGADTLSEYLGLPYNTKYADPPNSYLYVAGEKIPAVGSFMMPREPGFVIGLARFILMRMGYAEVIQHDGMLVGTNHGDGSVYHPRSTAYGKLSCMNSGIVWPNPLAARNPHPHIGTKNIHSFTNKVL